MGLSDADIKKLEEMAYQVRKDIIDVTVWAGGGHLGGGLSQADILVALYFHYMNIDPKNPEKPDRDRLILSKGHGGVGYAPVLAERGYFDKKLLETFNHTGSPFGMHLDKNKVIGVDASTGSLGHGLALAVGLALGAKLDKASYKVYCVMGDGEQNEGSVWEAAMAGAHFKCTNCIAIVDRNKLCIDGDTEDIMSIEPLDKKWEAFGWDVIIIDGHNMKEIGDAIEKAQQATERPVCIIANTVKGKGVEFMENQPKWHYGGINTDLREQALASLKKVYGRG